MEFAPTISAKELGIEGNTDAQLQYLKDNVYNLLYSSLKKDNQ